MCHSQIINEMLKVLCDVDKYSRCGFYYVGSTLKFVLCPDTPSGQATMYSACIVH